MDHDLLNDKERELIESLAKVISLLFIGQTIEVSLHALNIAIHNILDYIDNNVGREKANELSLFMENSLRDIRHSVTKDHPESGKVIPIFRTYFSDEMN